MDSTPRRNILGTSSEHLIRGPAKVQRTISHVLSIGVSVQLLEVDCVLEKTNYMNKIFYMEIKYKGSM